MLDNALKKMKKGNMESEEIRERHLFLADWTKKPL